MKLSQFQYHLPHDLLAQYPSKQRDECKLMVVDRKTGKFENKVFKDIMNYFMSVNSEYDEMIWSPQEFNSPEVLMHFYTKNWEKPCKCVIGRFEKYDPSKRQLFALTPRELEDSKYSSRFTVKKTIKHPNGNIGFLIGEISDSF